MVAERQEVQEEAKAHIGWEAMVEETGKTAVAQMEYDSWHAWEQREEQLVGASATISRWR